LLWMVLHSHVKKFETDHSTTLLFFHSAPLLSAWCAP
jgi:hypothetical protein